jgi:hypothetical protein
VGSQAGLDCPSHFVDGRVVKSSAPLRTYQLDILTPEVLGWSYVLQLQDDKIKKVPEVYRDFTDIFSKAKVNILAPHQPCNLKISMEDGTELLYGDIYSLSATELKALHKYTFDTLEFAKTILMLSSFLFVFG